MRLTTEQKAANKQQRKEARLAYVKEPQFVKPQTRYYYANRERILAAGKEKRRLSKAAYQDSDDEINFGVIQWACECEKAWLERESQDSWCYRK